MPGSVTLFHVRGIPIRAHPSWLLILALLTWNLAVGYFPQVLPDLPAAALWIRGLVAALLLFASVFLHELAHSITALRYGIPVSSITLHIFGGVSQMERELRGRDRNSPSPSWAPSRASPSPASWPSPRRRSIPAWGRGPPCATW